MMYEVLYEFDSKDEELKGVKICRTENYSIFKFTVWNRMVEPRREDRIRESIENHGFLPSFPLVNENLGIIDGQGRISALKRIYEETGKVRPLCFVMAPGLGKDECLAMNTTGEIWVTYDYMRSYKNSGNENYIKLDSICEEYRAYGLSDIDIAMCLSESVSRNIQRNLKYGYYKYDDSEKNIGCLEFVAGIYRDLNSVRGGAGCYLQVLVGLYKFDLIDPFRMTSAIRQNHQSMMSAYNNESALNELQRIYNLKRREKKFFRDAYLEKMTQKGARYGSKDEVGVYED